MKEFVVLSRYDLLALLGDAPVEIHIDGKPFTLCSDEYFEKQKDEEVDECDTSENKVIVTSLSFSTFQHICKYYHIGFDEDHFANDTCRYKASIPKGCSWGECKQKICPFLNHEEAEK